MAEATNFTWNFQRLGGMDQVTLATAEELVHLGELDPKLWATLSCPASGLEFDARTLALLDTDKDGRIRIPEVLAAVDWACARLSDPALLAQAPETLALDQINGATEAGARLIATGHAILEKQGLAESTPLTREIVERAAAQTAEMVYNGDGVIPPHPELDAEMRAFIEQGISVVGCCADENGVPGLNRDLAAAFMRSLAAWQSWRVAVAAAPHPLGADTAEAWTLLGAIADKVDDYFLRCQLASFAPQIEASLNAETKLLAAVEQGDLAASVLEALPLSRVAADGGLNLSAGLNPLWKAKVERFAALAAPLLGQGPVLTQSAWESARAALAPYGAAQAARPAPEALPCVTTPPAAAAQALDALGDAGVAALLASGVDARFAELAERDLSTPAASRDIAELDRLLLYVRNLHRLLMNFVSFCEFYSMRGTATFQMGTLYLDGRACHLCLPAQEADKHAVLAKLSQLCLVYCKCCRTRSGGAAPDIMNIVAAVTSGGDDFLMEGRNGVFVDNFGQDWDATLTKIVRNPISLRAAMWSPYKRISQLLGSQLAKAAANRSQSIVTSAGQKVGTSVAGVASGAAPGMPFDIGKSVGIFAAVGIALGALGTAVGSIASALLALRWWQLPFLLLGCFILISGPSVLLAWLKLRKRTLAPLLEASGWAVNSQLPINLKLGGALTARAVLPANVTTRRFQDPFRDNDTHVWAWVLLAALLAGVALGGWLWYTGRLAWLFSCLAGAK